MAHLKIGSIVRIIIKEYLMFNEIGQITAYSDPINDTFGNCYHIKFFNKKTDEYYKGVKFRDEELKRVSEKEALAYLI